MIRPLLPHVRLVEVDLPEFDARGAVVLGEGHAMVWDTLASPADMAPVVPLVSGHALTIAYSHADWDHVWGTAAFAGMDAAIVAHETCAQRFASEVADELSEKRREEPGRFDDVLVIPPTHTFSEYLELDVGGVPVVLSHFPGHTPDGIVAFLPASGVLLAGDAVELPLPYINRAEDVPGWIARLEQWGANAAVRRVVPSHGPVGGRELIVATADYLRRISSGNDIAVPVAWTGFYRETHESNLRCIEAWSAD